MLKSFTIPEEDMLLVQEADLHQTVSAIFQKLNVPQADAEVGASVLISADLRGIDSHGVSNQLRKYVTDYNGGLLNPRPNVRIVRETPATANIDSDGGLGIITTPAAMEVAIRKAESTGIGMVTVHNGKHLGMASYHAMMALEHDMIGVCMTSTRPSVLPTFGREPRLGTNPIAVAAPAKSEPPFVLDIATSAVASNKFDLAKRLAIDVEGGWLSDENGTPLMAPTPLPDVYHGLPLGATRELGSHKGYGLGAVVDILCGILSGNGSGMTAGVIGNYSHMVAAYRIDAFAPVDQFKEMMDELLRTLKETPAAPGHERVLYPGLPEFEVELKRKANGIPLHREVIDWFRDICGEMDIPFLSVG